MSDEAKIQFANNIKLKRYIFGRPFGIPGCDIVIVDPAFMYLFSSLLNVLSNIL